MPVPSGYNEQPPGPWAARRVETTWTFVAAAAGTSIILPDCRCDLILRMSADRPGQVTPVVTGPATRPFRVGYQAGDSWIGLRLRPSLGQTLWGGDLAAARDQALRGGQSFARFPGLAGAKDARALCAVLPPPVPVCATVTDALDLLHLTGGRARITAMSRTLGCSPRHLSRLFRAYVGVPPKTYASLVKFYRALRLIRQAGLSPASAALEAGYADQAHLTRAFRRFGGFSPRQIPNDLTVPGVFA